MIIPTQHGYRDTNTGQWASSDAYLAQAKLWHDIQVQYAETCRQFAAIQRQRVIRRRQVETHMGDDFDGKIRTKLYVAAARAQHNARMFGLID